MHSKKCICINKRKYMHYVVGCHGDKRSPSPQQMAKAEDRRGELEITLVINTRKHNQIFP
jgi:hypothetical protein